MSLLWSIFEGYKEAKKDEFHQRKFDELSNYPMLFSSNYLNELLWEAGDLQDLHDLLHYMERYNCVDVGIETYDKVYYKAKDQYKKMWEKENKK